MKISKTTLLGMLLCLMLLGQVALLLVLVFKYDVLQKPSWRLELALLIVILLVFAIGALYPKRVYERLACAWAGIRQHWKYLFFSLLFILLAFEIMVRVLFHGAVMTYTQATNFERYRLNGQPSVLEDIYRASDVFFYQLQPDLDVQIVDRLYDLDYHLRTNQEGFRVVEDASVPTPGGQIMILGDSVTLGAGVNQGATFADALQDLWQDQYTIHNLSTNGWGIAEYYVAFQHYSTRLDPALVIVGLYPTNDFNDLSHTQWSGRRQGQLPTAPLERSDLRLDEAGHLYANTFYYQVPILRESAGFVFVMKFLIEPQFDRAAKLLRQYRDPLTNTEFSLQIIADIARHAPVLVLLLPSQADFPAPRFLPPDYVDRLERLEDVHVLDLHPLIAPHHAKSYLDGFHFTADAHRQIGATVHQFVNAQGLLDARPRQDK
jgi:hypothetical protein